MFPTVSGLETEAKVRMAGVLVGSVDRIFLKDGRAHTLLRLDDGVVVREDSVVSVASIGILSERYIEITTGSQTARALAPGAVVEGQPLVDLDQLMAEMARVLGGLPLARREHREDLRRRRLPAGAPADEHLRPRRPGQRPARREPRGASASCSRSRRAPPATPARS